VIGLKIIAIIPTHNRTSDFNRAFESISSQSRPADYVLVIHEKEDDYPRLLSGNNVHATINKRTKSLSGAINHAVDEIILNRHIWKIELDSTWLALLDDDDWWDPEYLEKCVSLADGQSHQVVAGLIRYDKSNPDGFNLSIPEELQCDSFLIKNPHIQGSNLFVRMDSFLGAGGFDESILSCTDRDFCIRLFDNKNHHWKRLNQHLVHHDARKPGRISDPKSKRKMQGVRRFAMKHQFRMNEDQWHKFLEVSKEQFGIELDIFDTPSETQIHSEKNESNHSMIEREILDYDLTIGVTFSHPELVKKFVSSLKKIVTKWPSNIRLVACLHKINASEINAAFDKACLANLELVIYDEKSAIELANVGGLGPWFLDERCRSGVSWGRCVLHRRLLDEIRDDNRPLIWIVDEDMQLHLCNTDDPDYEGIDALSKVVSHMEHFGIDVGIGRVIGDPPIHPLFTLRTQLLDLYYSRLMENCGVSRINWNIDNLTDVHHDLSTSRFDHLEFPWGLFNLKSNNSDTLELIQSGKFTSRPVHSDWRQRTDEDLLVRGGNTIILDPTSLAEWSNVAPLISNIQTRRGDSFWSLYAQRIEGRIIGNEYRKVNWVPFAVPQERNNSPVETHDINNIRGDIIGSMIMRNLSQIFSSNQMVMNRKLWDDGGWEKGFAENVLMESKLREARLISNLYRVVTLEQYMGHDSSNIEIAKKLFNSIIGDDIIIEIENIFKEMPANMSRFRSSQPKIRPRYRISEAVKNLRIFGDYTDFEMRGDGSEGVVFKNEDLAIKVHHDGIKLSDENINLIIKFSTTSVSCLPKNFKLQNSEPTIISYDWVEGEHPNFETNARPWLDLLRECKENNFVYWDLKPHNLILTPENRLVIIDIGRDLKPFKNDDWVSMVRKAYLCWKHWDKTNLRELLTRSLRDTEPHEFPELEGIEIFKNAIEIQDKSDLHDPWFIELLGSNYSGRVLDWGCGSGRLTKQIAELGYKIDAYDPLTELQQKVTTHPHVNWINGPKEVKKGKYSLVICNLVLCDIESDKEVLEVLKIISDSLTHGGHAIVTVCHPDSVDITCTTTIQKPKLSLTDDKISYHKTVRSTGQNRVEHTRSQSFVEQLAASVGLVRTREFHSPGINVNDCTPIHEFLGLEFTKT
jgi:2-polyprenyl-3-methyl-5-hydroxy-6-metoxy-1,4-benzoquinol methylase/GT2 family glycosyltransferase